VWIRLVRGLQIRLQLCEVWLGSEVDSDMRRIASVDTSVAAIIVLTGVSDYLSDGDIVLKASNGHPLVCPLACPKSAPN